MTGGRSRPLRVGFDGRTLISPAGGIRRYASELFRAMAAMADVELVALGAPPAVDLPSTITRRPSVIEVPTNIGRTQLALPMTARGASVDLFHAPAYTAPLWGMPPVVLTIHDVSYARHPEWYPYRRDPFRRAYYRACAMRAERIVTDSEFSRTEIQAAYGIEPARISVVPLGVGGAFHADGQADPTATEESPYLVHVGDLHPRRNLETALQAVWRVRQTVRDLRALRLVLVGVDRGSRAELETRAGASGAGSCLDFRASVADDDLAALYRGALALIYPSRYEGFGLPLVEAMACGTPVIASNASSIPEVVGSAGLLIDPDDLDGFVDAVTSVGCDEGLRRRLRQASLDRASAFTWARSAQKTVLAYRLALGV